MKRIVIDIKTGQVKGSIDVIENDNKSDVYKIYILKNKAIYDLTGKMPRMVMIDKKQNIKQVIDLNITDAKRGEVSLQVSDAWSREDGKYICQLAIFGLEGFLEQSTYFWITIKNSLFNDIGDEILADPQFEMLKQELEKFQVAFAKIDEWDKYFKETSGKIEEKYTERLNEINSQLSENVQIDLQRQKQQKTNLNLDRIKYMIKQSYEGLRNDIRYIVVGDSTRASFGEHIFKMIQEVLEPCGVKCFLQAKSGLKAEHWSDTTVNLQGSTFPRVSDLLGENPNTWDVIPNDGSGTIIDICLGINDSATKEQLKTYIKNGIDKIKAKKPNVTIILTTPNRTYADRNTKIQQAYDELVYENGYGYIEVMKYVFETWQETAGYFVDETHPNEYGQKRIGKYILEQIVPQEILDTSSKVPQNGTNVSGYRWIATTFDWINIVTDEALNKVFVKRIDNNNLVFCKEDDTWISGNYIFNSDVMDTYNKTLTIVNNGIIRLYDRDFPTNKKYEFIFKVRDYTALNNLRIGEMYEINSNCIVKVFNFIDDYKIKLEEREVQLLKGYLYEADNIHYNLLKDAGIRLEIKYLEGTAQEGKVYLKKINGTWYIVDDNSGSALSEGINLKNGIQMLKQSSYSSKKVVAKIFIENSSILANFKDSTSYTIEFKNAIVNDFTKSESITSLINSLKYPIIQ